MTPPGTDKRVLLVDDDPALLRLVELWLSGGGYQVISCGSFEDARQQLMRDPPGLLLADVRLGAYNGLHLVIFAKEVRPDVAVVVMSAYDDPTLRREAAQCGAVYLMKPFSSDALLKALAQAPSPLAE